MKNLHSKLPRRILLTAVATQLVLSIVATPAMAASPGPNSSGSMSLGAVLAQVGSILVKSLESTTASLSSQAKELDAVASSGGPTATLNQKTQELTFV